MIINNINEYEFHIGDYVEDLDGRIGYIADICDCDRCVKRGFSEPTIIYQDGDIDYISDYSVNHLKNNYVRIGKYKFNGRTNNEIEKLNIQLKYKDVNATKMTVNTNGFTTYEFNTPQKIIDGIEEISCVDLYSKINEIIEVVNEIRKER